jgi:hypothetical protein
MTRTPHMQFADNPITRIHRETGINARQWERFIVNRPARLTAVNSGLNGTSSRPGQVVDISRGGAGIVVQDVSGLPDHYYLTIVGTNERIGCAEVYRSGTRLGVRFIKIIDDDFVSRIVRGDFFTR